MRMETEKARATDAITEGIGDASESWQFLTILKWQCVVIWKPSQIFERSEEGASSRKGACPFAFEQLPREDFARRLCSGASECARNAMVRSGILRA
jgi:hypothetical protein